jgi:hypothetical protein
MKKNNDSKKDDNNDSKKDKKSKGIWVGIVLSWVGAAFSWVGTGLVWTISNYNKVGDFFVDCIALPQWRLYHEAGKDIISVDNVKLINGKMVVCPTLCIYRGKELVDIIVLSQYYNQNYAIIEKNKDEDEDEFVFELDEEQREKVEDIIAQIKKNIVEQDTEIVVQYFVQVTFKSNISFRSGDNEFCILPGDIREITDDEKKIWESRYMISVEDYEIDFFEKMKLL